jgi:hypothetical protein
VTSNILTHLWKNFQRTDKAVAENTQVNLGATVSLTATGNRGLNYRQDEKSIFDYSKTSTNL